MTEIPPPPSRKRGGSTHTLSRIERSVVDTGMVLQDDFPLGWSAFQSSPTNQVDCSEAPPLPPSIHQDEDDVWRAAPQAGDYLGGSPTPPLLSAFLDPHQEGLPQGSLLLPMLRTGMYLNLIGLGVPIPGLARNPRTSFRDRGGGSLAMVGPPLPRSPGGEHCIHVRRFLLGAIDWALAQSMPKQLGAASCLSEQLKPTSTPGSVLPGWSRSPCLPCSLLPGIGIWGWPSFPDP